MKQLDPKAVYLFMIDRKLVVNFFGFALIVSLIIGLVSSGSSDGVSGIDIVLLYLLAFTLAIINSFIWAKLTYKFYRYELSIDAYHSERGVIVKKYISIPYERIQNVDINRGIIARLLGLSDIDIQTAGRSSSGFSSEGRLPGIDQEEAVKLRNELIRLAKSAKSGV